MLDPPVKSIESGSPNLNIKNNPVKITRKEIPKYIKFAPGSNYIVTRDNILKHPKSFYEKLRHYIDYGPTPGEAQIIERFLYTLWTTDKKFNSEMLKLAPLSLFYRMYKKALIFFINNICYIKITSCSSLWINPQAGSSLESWPAAHTYRQLE